MGCDIHLHGEVKINGVWRHWSNPSIVRDYDMFAKMAGVRGSGEIVPIALPRGLPEDATFETIFDYSRMKSDAHSASYLTALEIGELAEFVRELYKARNRGEFWYEEKIWGFLFGNHWQTVKKFPNDYPKGVEDSRFVFWFDN